MTETVANADLRAAGQGKFSLSGELTFASVPYLWRKGKYPFPDADRVALDLGEVTHSDSAGLALMLEWLRQSRIRSAALEFRNVPKQMLSLARTAGIDSLLRPSEPRINHPPMRKS
uniref:Phospholipid transport system transporter-binding protein n=1 Tax=Candidatus Kentrum sp. SD TaxID=2126332 RepID=A0A450YJ68_9GAMM|nr:MAG: phospholipid transport system transporter-binding protein [Candidatus Kentron sp. SD]VFK47627.1 MAG: phospholipid transport system transporter-binding protein [Candidatus Kentron sp. SD]